jgi:hypothetical protein
VKKRRVTLHLDPGRSLFAVANDALRGAVAGEAHRAALLRWLDELDSPTGQALRALLRRAVERGGTVRCAAVTLAEVCRGLRKQRLCGGDHQ